MDIRTIFLLALRSTQHIGSGTTQWDTGMGNAYVIMNVTLYTVAQHSKYTTGNMNSCHNVHDYMLHSMVLLGTHRCHAVHSHTLQQHSLTTQALWQWRTRVAEEYKCSWQVNKDRVVHMATLRRPGLLPHTFTNLPQGIVNPGSNWFWTQIKANWKSPPAPFWVPFCHLNWPLEVGWGRLASRGVYMDRLSKLCYVVQMMLYLWWMTSYCWSSGEWSKRP